MSDWLRVFNPLSLVLFGAECLAWAAGGWLAVRAWFHLRPGENLVTGLAAGFVMFLTLVNLLTPLTGLSAAGMLGALAILLAGLAAAWRERPSPANLRADLQAWPQLAALLALTLLFELAQRGVSIFDEYLHLPMVSIMGTGIIPPRFYLNPELNFAYHYGLQVFSAVLENTLRFFPWSAWDLARALAIALTLNLAWLWGRRAGRGLAGTLCAALLVFGSGARWLLLLLPGSMLNWLGQGVQLSNTGADTASNLALALTRPWAIEGGGNMPFPFAFHNGIFIGQFFILGSTGALPALTVLLLLLLARPVPALRRPGGAGVVALLLANLALSAEHLFAFLWLAIALVGVFAAVRAWRARQPFDRALALGWALVLGISGGLSVFQGGFVTETLRSLLLNLQGQSPAASNAYGFALRWPPAIITAHLGQLSPFNLRQLPVLLTEMGPALLAAPLASYLSWRSIRRGDWLTAGLGLAALLMIGFTLFVEYGVDRSSTRFAGSTLWLWLVLAFPLLWRAYLRARSLGRAWLGGLFGVSVYAGLVLFAIQLTSVPQPIPAYYIDSLDQRMSAKYWNALEPTAQVFDVNPERAVAVFGRISKANASIYVHLPAWETLLAAPTPQNVASSGYTYVYMNERWWNEMTPSLRQTYQQACVKIAAEEQNPNSQQFRRLLDIRDCH